MTVLAPDQRVTDLKSAKPMHASASATPRSRRTHSAASTGTSPIAINSVTMRGAIWNIYVMHECLKGWCVGFWGIRFCPGARCRECIDNKLRGCNSSAGWRGRKGFSDSRWRRGFRYSRPIIFAQTSTSKYKFLMSVVNLRLAKSTINTKLL